MTIKQYLPVLVCCLSLAACGGGGSDAVGAAGSVPTVPTVPTAPTAPTANSAPTASAVTITDSNGGSVVVGDTLVGSYTYADADGDIEGASTFRWLRNGVAISGAVAANYLLITADTGTSITFEVTPVAATGVIVGAAASSASVAVVNSAPTASAVTVTDSNGGNSVVGDTLLGGYTYADADGDIEGISTFRWMRNGAAIAAAVAANYTIVAADVGATISFEVTPVAKTGVTTGQATVSPVGVIASSLYVSALITPSRTACTAPCGIMFDSKGSSTTPAATQPFFELDYKWDYGDVGATFQQRPGINANKSSSPIGAHVYSKPGTYTTTLTVTDNKGRSASKQVVINVADPNVVYLGNTYCVSNTNNFVDCPTPAPAFHILSFSAASSKIAGFRATPNVPRRVLFHVNETFDASGSITIIRDLTAPLLIASYGVGANPIITSSIVYPLGIFHVGTSDGVTFTGLVFSGNYSPITGMGIAAGALFFSSSDTNSLIYRNNFSGMKSNVDIRDVIATVKPKFNMVVDNYMTNWQNIGIFGSFGFMGAILGNKIKQNILAKSGAEGKCGTCQPNFPNHGPVRLELADHMLIQHNDMFNNAGWSSGGLAHQPNIRLGTNGTVTKSIVADNILEGGFAVMEMLPANRSLQAVKGEVIIERNKFTATSNTQSFIDTKLGGSVIRNNLFLKPNNAGPSVGTSTFDTAINYSAHTVEGPINLTLINQVYNNTLVSIAQTSAPVLKLVSVQSAFSLFEIHNNLVYAPLVAAGGEAGLLAWKYNVPLTNVHASNNLIFMPSNTNFVWKNGVSETLANWQASGNGIGSLTIDPLLTNPNIFDATLKANSPAIDAGSNTLGLMSDFNDKLRTAIPDIGALEF